MNNTLPIICSNPIICAILGDQEDQVLCDTNINLHHCGKDNDLLATIEAIGERKRKRECKRESVCFGLFLFVVAAITITLKLLYY